MRGSGIILIGVAFLACLGLSSAISCFVCTSYPPNRNNSNPIFDKGDPCLDLNATTTTLPLIDCSVRANNLTAVLEHRPNKCITVKTYAMNLMDAETIKGHMDYNFKLVSRFCGYSDRVEDECEATHANQADQVQCWCGTDGCNSATTLQLTTTLLASTILAALFL